MVQLSSLEIDTATRIQILDEAVCISDSTNTLEKGMNSTILPTALEGSEGILYIYHFPHERAKPTWAGEELPPAQAVWDTWPIFNGV